MDAPTCGICSKLASKRGAVRLQQSRISGEWTTPKRPCAPGQGHAFCWVHTGCAVRVLGYQQVRHECQQEGTWNPH